MYGFSIFQFEKNYEVLIMKKKVNFNKNKAESKMENLTHLFRKTNLVLQLM